MMKVFFMSMSFGYPLQAFFIFESGNHKCVCFISILPTFSKDGRRLLEFIVRGRKLRQWIFSANKGKTYLINNK